MPADGSDFAQDDVCGFDDINEIKNSYGGAVAPTAPVTGVTWWDTGNSLWKVYNSGWGELESVFGIALDGMIFGWIGGYYTDGSNGGYQYVLGSANTIAGANSYLNTLGIYVCDGTVPNEGDSGIWNAAGRYLPNISDDRFLMGDTVTAGLGGSNTNAHTHDADPTSKTSTAPNTEVEVNYDAGGAQRPSHNHTHDLDIDNKTSDAASNTENRPKFLGVFMVAKVK